VEYRTTARVIAYNEVAMRRFVSIVCRAYLRNSQRLSWAHSGNSPVLQQSKPRNCRRKRAKPSRNQERRAVSVPEGRCFFRQLREASALHERGYYREFTVPAPASRDRGARRI